MLKLEKPSHPEYLAMLQCIDARRDERLRTQNHLKKFQMGSLNRTSTSKRSQILAQYQQTVRDLREKALEDLGKKWYEIQHDRRAYAGNVPDYALRFPEKRLEQVSQQASYNKEVSILSGIAKYVGFPAAPQMASATAMEFEDDMEKMNVSH